VTTTQQLSCVSASGHRPLTACLKLPSLKIGDSVGRPSGIYSSQHLLKQVNKHIECRYLLHQPTPQGGEQTEAPCVSLGSKMATPFPAEQSSWFGVLYQIEAVLYGPTPSPRPELRSVTTTQQLCCVSASGHRPLTSCLKLPGSKIGRSSVNQSQFRRMG